jgi:hypothetical protein
MSKEQGSHQQQQVNPGVGNANLISSPPLLSSLLTAVIEIAKYTWTLTVKNPGSGTYLHTPILSQLFLPSFGDDRRTDRKKLTTYPFWLCSMPIVPPV